MTDGAEFVNVHKPGLERLGVVTVKHKRLARWQARGWKQGRRPAPVVPSVKVGKGRRRSQKDRIG